MGNSHPETKPWIMECVMTSGVTSILDVGAGAGIYADVLASLDWWGAIDAVEVWKPYIDEFDLTSKYSTVHQADIRHWQDFDYDLVIFGDVMEHMTKMEAQAVWAKAQTQAKFGVIAIPITHFEQGPVNGNPYEVHVTEDWTQNSVLEAFTGITTCFIGEVTGAFWAPFERFRQFTAQHS